jgi:hypothetical protein
MSNHDIGPESNIEGSNQSGASEQPHVSSDPSTPDSAVIETRKKNATGPRTLLGKERSKYNAMKHGICSNQIVSKNETPAEYEALVEGLWDHFQPVGVLEEFLVDKLATICVRYRRFLKSEHAEIEKNDLLVKNKDFRGFSRGNPGIDILIRYSAALNREFRETLAQLESIQRTRKGQPLAPRIEVNVSHD